MANPSSLLPAACARTLLAGGTDARKVGRPVTQKKKKSAATRAKMTAEGPLGEGEGWEVKKLVQHERAWLTKPTSLS
jgi:hypothetical protein